MSLQIKASGVNNLTDARYFNALENTFIGFNFDVLHPQHITLSQAEDLAGWLYNPLLVAEFGIHQTKEEIDYILNKISFVGIELPYENRNIYNDYKQIRFLKVNNTSEKLEPKELDFLILKSVNNTSDLINLPLKIFIEIDDPKNNLFNQIIYRKLAGVSLNGKKEERPGWSMIDEWGDFIDKINSQ